MACASFSTLPPELKARIVEIASDQEDAYKERVQNAEERASHINGLSALALVNKELRDLAAKHQFKLSEEGERELEDALAIMPQLPSLRGLSVALESAVALFGPGVTLGAAPYRAAILDRISAQITLLVLNEFTPSTSIALVQKFPNLRTLCFRTLGDGINEEETKELVGAIASLRHLTHLAVDLAPATPAWPMEVLGPLASAPPPIQTLQLLWFPLDHHTIDLIRLFGSTLETLCLELRSTGPDSESDLSKLDPLQLPRLTTLNLVKEEPSGFDHLTRLLASTSTLSTLSSLSFALTQDGWLDSTMLALVRVISSQTTLRRLQLGETIYSHPVFSQLSFEDGLASPSSLAAYADLIHSRGLDPTVLDRPHLTPFHPKANLDYTENEGEYLAEVLDRTLNFGRTELKRMVAEGRAASAVEWVEMLKPLEAKRLAWKD
ncbi:hypothetical protein RQP46_002456 [Phenoliferia psychrophenolica]